MKDADLALGRPATWDEKLAFNNSYERAATLVDARWNIEDECWLALVGRWWASIDGRRDELVSMMRDYVEGCPSLIRNLMTDEERATLAAMPEVLTVWRGAYRRVNQTGVSWSLSREVASEFPFTGRYIIDGRTPVLLEARVRRDQCALKLDRNELEVIVLRRPRKTVGMTYRFTHDSKKMQALKAFSQQHGTVAVPTPA